MKRVTKLDININLNEDLNYSECNTVPCIIITEEDVDDNAPNASLGH